MTKSKHQRPAGSLPWWRATGVWPYWTMAAMLLSTVAVAAHGAPELTDLSLDELLGVEVVFSASKYEQHPLDAPASVSIVTREEIEAHGYRTLAEILGATRGIFTTYDRTYHYAGIRGFGRPGDYNSRLLLLVDGARLNDNIYESAGIGGDFPVDIDLIERVEIVRGPSSSIYGTSALFGVVNVVTRTGESVDGLEVSIGTGSFDTQSADLRYGMVSDNGVELLASASILDSGGQRLYFSEFDSPESDDGIADIDDEKITSFFVSSSYRDLEFEAFSSRREKGIPTASWETEFADPRTRSFDDQDRLTLTFDRSGDRAWGLLARASYNRYAYVGDYAFDYGEEDEPYVVVNRDDALGEWWGGELQLKRRLPAGHTVLLGTELRDNFRQNQSNFDEEIYLDERNSTVTWGAYAQGEFLLGQKLRVNGGLRYDNYQDLDSRLSPRLALIYRSSESSSWKLLAGTAFRAPSAYERYYHDGEYTSKAPTSLESETIETLELVWERELASGWKLAASLYDYDLRDLINYTTDPADELLVFSNLNRAEANGVEVELAGTLRGGIGGRFSYSRQRVKDGVSGETLSNTPEHLAKVLLTRPISSERIRVGAQLDYMSTRRALDGTIVDDHLVTNFTLASDLWDERGRVTMGLFNLFDESFGDPGSEEHEQRMIPQNGRSWWLELSWRF